MPGPTSQPGGQWATLLLLHQKDGVSCPTGVQWPLELVIVTLSDKKLICRLMEHRQTTRDEGVTIQQW